MASCRPIRRDYGSEIDLRNLRGRIEVGEVAMALLRVRASPSAPKWRAWWPLADGDARDRPLDHRRVAVPERGRCSADDHRRGGAAADDAGELDVVPARLGRVAILHAGARRITEPEPGGRGEGDQVAVSLVAVVGGTEARPVREGLGASLRGDVEVAVDLAAAAQRRGDGPWIGLAESPAGRVGQGGVAGGQVPRAPSGPGAIGVDPGERARIRRCRGAGWLPLTARAAAGGKRRRARRARARRRGPDAGESA